MVPSHLVLLSAEDWKHLHRGLKCLFLGLLLHLLGILLAAFCLIYLLVFATQSRYGPTGWEVAPLAILIIIGGISTLVSSIVILVAMFVLIYLAGVSRIARWASWGLRLFLPLSVVMVVGACSIVSNGTGNLGSHLPFFLIVFGTLFCTTLCFTHILRATASSCGEQALGILFAICFVVFWYCVVAWGVMLLSSYNYVSAPILSEWSRSHFYEYHFFELTLATYLVPLSLYLFLLNQLLRQVSEQRYAERIAEPDQRCEDS